MDLAHRIRIGLAAAIAICAAASIGLAANVTAGAPAAQLQPDLRTLAPAYEPSLQLQKTGSGKTILRLSNRIANAGKGPLELFATDPPSGVCESSGQFPDGADLDANQRIFEDSNGNQQYDPEGSAQPDGVAEEPRVGCFEFHPKHNHWHFQDFSQYSLTDIHTQELLAGPSRKIGFCVVDGDRPYPGLPGSPDLGVYPEGSNGCGFGDPDGGPGRMGLSVGYADTYSYDLPGQRLDLTGVKKGIYCLVSTANPEHAVDDPSQIIESDLSNNSRRHRIKVEARTGKTCTGLTASAVRIG